MALVESRGIRLTKNGKGYKGRCPFHEDQDPSFSVNPDKNLWNCFGCDKGGDAIRFVELYDHVDFQPQPGTSRNRGQTTVSTDGTGVVTIRSAGVGPRQVQIHKLTTSSRAILRA